MKILIESSLDSSIKQQALLGKMIDFLIKSIHARLIRIARFILEEFFFCAFPDLRFRSIPRYWTIHYGIFFFNYLNFPRFSTHLFSYIPELLVIDVFLSKTCPNSSLFHHDVAFCNIEKTSIYKTYIYYVSGSGFRRGYSISNKSKTHNLQLCLQYCKQIS